MRNLAFVRKALLRAGAVVQVEADVPISWAGPRDLCLSVRLGRRTARVSRRPDERGLRIIVRQDGEPEGSAWEWYTVKDAVADLAGGYRTFHPDERGAAFLYVEMRSTPRGALSARIIFDVGERDREAELYDAAHPVGIALCIDFCQGALSEPWPLLDWVADNVPEGSP